MATVRAFPGTDPISGPSAERVDMKFEVVVIPVADVDRSKEFYTKLGWRLDADFRFDNGFRVLQFTPPGSGCSVQFGTKITSAAPGSAQGLYLIASDVEAARRDLVARGIDVSEVFHPGTPGAQFQIDGSGRIDGPAPEHATYNSFATFRDPDGNGWLFQEVTTRLPGRGPSNLDVATLTELLLEAEKHHGEYEPTAPKHQWSGSGVGLQFFEHRAPVFAWEIEIQNYEIGDRRFRKATLAMQERGCLLSIDHRTYLVVLLAAAEDLAHQIDVSGIVIDQ